VSKPDWNEIATPSPETEQQFADEQARENAADLANGLMDIFKMEIRLLKLKLQKDIDND
tara:strand:+ start:370 stop:546 length:177 start_codon:yes stop_codon:yes gene_type:complete